MYMYVIIQNYYQLLVRSRTHKQCTCTMVYMYKRKINTFIIKRSPFYKAWPMSALLLVSLDQIIVGTGQYYNQPAGYNYTGEQTRGSPSSYTRGPPHSRGASQHHQYPSYGSR